MPASDWLLRERRARWDAWSRQIKAGQTLLSGVETSTSHEGTMSEGRRIGAAVHLAVVIILVWSLAQTIDCYRLRKTERREGRKYAARTTGVQEGTIVFGKSVEVGSGFPSPDGAERSSNSSVEEEGTAYQADFAGENQTWICLVELLLVLR